MGMILDSHGLSQQETTETFTMEPGPFPRKEVSSPFSKLQLYACIILMAP